jgi:hypothetical protein
MKKSFLFTVFVSVLLTCSAIAQNKGEKKEDKSDSDGSASSTSASASGSSASTSTGGEAPPPPPITVTSSQPSAAAAAVTQSNPFVYAVAVLGTSIEEALTFTPKEIDAIAKSMNSKEDFSTTIKDLSKKSDSERKTAVENYEKAAASGSGSYFSNFTSNQDLIDLAEAVVAKLGYRDTYIETAVTKIDSYLKSYTISGTGAESQLPTPENVSSLSTGVTYELLKMLGYYGALGPNSEAIISKLGITKNESLTAESSTSDYLSYLGQLIDKPTITKNLTDADGNPLSVTKVPTANINASGGNDFTLGGSTATTIDVNTYLPAVATSGPDESPSEENIYIIGAIKDIITAGGVTFKNTNDAEDHALVLAAGDQLGVYHDITYEGSNLVLGQAGKTTDSTKDEVINDKRALLIQADISTGGNLAIGSLGQIQVKGSTFTLGTANETSAGSGVYTSDKDNLYMIANDLIEINGLSFDTTARVDDIYMEAITVNLKDITFPALSDVYIRTKYGTTAFGTFDNPAIGAANFTNVYHPDISSTDPLNSGHFSDTGKNTLQTAHKAVTVGKL